MKENNEHGRRIQGDGAEKQKEHGKQRDREILSRAHGSQPMPQVSQRIQEDIRGTRIILGDRKTREAQDPLTERGGSREAHGNELTRTENCPKPVVT